MEEHSFIKSSSNETLSLFDWLSYIKKLPNILEKIMTKVSDLYAQLVAIDNQLTKAQTEILGKIQELQDALQNVALPADAEQAFTDLKTATQALDNIVPDVPITPTP